MQYLWMAKLLATSAIRGSQQSESHGAIHIVDLDEERVYQPVDWNPSDIDWQGQDGARGLRGVAFHRERVFVVASDELFEYNPNFELVASYRNPFLKNCHAICVHKHHLFITSTAFDSILAFNLRRNNFDMALMMKTDGQNLAMGKFNPNSDDGPLPMNKLHINTIFCEEGGMYIAGLKTGGLLLYNGKRVGLSATLPTGAHDARPFRDGIVFNDTDNNHFRYATRTGKDDCAFKQNSGRGLCAVSDTVIAAGSSPATIALYDLEQKKMTKAVNISKDDRNTIHSLAVWPFS